MGLIKYHLGDLLELTTEVNSDNKYHAEDVRGMTITKEIIPTKADVADTDLSKFLVVHPNEFVFNPRTHGKKIGFGFNDTESSFLISWNNVAFRIKESFHDRVLPEYLFFHFNRSEWDREACFRSWGSSTEVFTWEALCDMIVDLPPLSVQQKYVDIYNSMVANQKCYERGLEDLKITIDALLDRYKHSSRKQAVGTFLKEVDVRNSKNEYTEVSGVNITKQFMPSVANSDDLHNYKIVNKNQFVFSGMQTGRDQCIRIALLDKNTPVIVSPAYSVLQVESDDIIPEFIQMWFSRSEMDRLGWFMSDSSIRSNLDLPRFYEIEIPVPSKVEQKSLIEIYSVYTARRAINERLKAQIKDICPVLVKGAVEEGKRND